MSSTKPYFIRAIHEWCSDEGFTPYLAVQVSSRTRVPREFVSDGQIVLNVSLDATHQLQIGNEEISFQTRFNGASFPVLVPVVDVVAIYARENGQGMAFEPGEPEETEASVEEGKVGAGETALESDVREPVDSTVRKSSHLTRIK
jgi:stringent starvation protein B